MTSVTATKGSGADNSIGCNATSTCGTVTIGGTVYWDGSAYQNGGDTYLAQATIVYPIPSFTINGSGTKVVFAPGNLQATYNGTSNARYTEATINTDATGINGMILFPDGVTIANGEATSWGNINSNSSWGTKCTSAQWTALEAKEQSRGQVLMEFY